jgi:hypothetical protein
VIVSVVRTERAGFLKSLERMNVMLTRCKKGMIIVTNKNFLQRDGRCTLLGRLADAWSSDPNAWTTRNAVLNGAADLPGVPLWTGVTESVNDQLASGLAGLSLEEDVGAWPLLGSSACPRPHTYVRSGRSQPSVRATTQHRLPALLAFPSLGEDVVPKAPVGVRGRGMASSRTQLYGQQRKYMA